MTKLLEKVRYPFHRPKDAYEFDATIFVLGPVPACMLIVIPLQPYNRVLR